MSESIKLDFEQGPIRPPNEAKSLLIRVTRNCSWNQCLFCPVYKGKTFSRRGVEEVKEDIRTIKKMKEDLNSLSRRLGAGGEVNDLVINMSFIMGSTNQRIETWPPGCITRSIMSFSRMPTIWCWARMN